MELVYLWVEDYKNIHEQGFNFSPKFTCDYNHKTNELSIDENDENDDYIENLFGENINVTAIVGKNGSGKSSVLECLIEIANTFFKDFVKEKKVFLIFYLKENNELWLVNDISSSKTIKKTTATLERKDLTEELRSIAKDIFFLHYDYSCTKFRLYENNKTVSSCEPYSLMDEYTLYENSSLTQLLPKKTGINNDNILGNDNYDKFVIMEILFSDKPFIEKGNIYFIPEEITLKKNLNGIDKKFKNLKHIGNEVTDALKYIEIIVYLDILDLIFKHKRVNSDDLLVGSDEINTFDKAQDYFRKKEDSFLEFFKRTPQKKEKVEVLYAYLEKIDKNKVLNQLFICKKEDSKPTFLAINKEYVKKDSISLFTEMPSQLFDIQILDKKGMEYNDLSNGEKSSLRIKSYIESILIKNKDKNNFFILLDEPANDMHPNWQKRLLKYLIDNFKDRKQNIHFIFTAHSPFMISDLAKQNIIFLNTYAKDEDKNQKEGNSKVVEGLSQTFGANIHTLLSDTFFMEDGLMGEFAKGKINDVYNFIVHSQTNKIKTKEEAQQIINIIGDALIKRQLEELYNQRFNEPSKDEIIESLRKEIESLKANNDSD